jgi:hypothetical protein
MTHVTRITKAGATHPIEPQSMVQLHPVTGDPLAPLDQGLTNDQLRATAVAVTGSLQVTTLTDACSRTYTYTNGLLTTVTATDGVSIWVKTYNYISGVLSAESKWVKQ